MLGRLRRALPVWIHVIVPAVFLLAVVGLFGADIEGRAPLVHDIRLKVFDAFQRRAPRRYEPAPVRIIDLDDRSLAKLGQWPWPRTEVARMVRRLSDLGASVIAFDAVFAEPDRTSPGSLRALWKSSDGALSAALGRLPDHDRVLAKAFSETRVVAGFALTAEANSGDPSLKATANTFGTDPVSFLDEFPGAVVNIPALERDSTGDGNFNFVADRDGVVRRVPLIASLRGKLVGSLVLEALRVAQGAPSYDVKSTQASGELSFTGRPGVARIRVGSMIVPTDEKGGVWLHDTGPVAERVIPAWRIYEKGFDPERVRGCILFVGTSAAGLKDLRSTPLNPVAAGVEVHAQITEQILLQHYLQRPHWAPVVELFYLLLLGTMLIALMPFLGAAWCAAVGGLATAGVFAYSWHAFTAWQRLYDPVLPSLAVLGVYLSSSLISFLKTEAAKKQTRQQFSRYVSPAFVEQLASQPELLKLGGETRNMTFMFTDIRGFTTISEQFDPHGLIQMINRYLTPMTDIIQRQRGTIDKYMGDCIMAFWNAPVEDPDHPKNAVRAALSMRARLKELNAQWEAEAAAERRKFIPIHSGIGLNTGDCVVGNMGSDQSFNYSVLGDEVNLASRLEGQSKNYGVDIVIGPGTREKVPEFGTLELDLIRVKGKTVPVRIFAVLGGPELREIDGFKRLSERHAAMLGAYRGQRWDEALALLKECRGLEPDLKKLYALYGGRIAACRESSPGADWDGVFTATEK